jgi:hypothetical protein
MRQHSVSIASAVIVALAACGPVPKETVIVTPASSPAAGNATAAHTATVPTASPCTVEATPAAGVGKRGLRHVLGLYEDGRFVMGVCVLEIPIDGKGHAGDPTFRRPRNPDPYLREAIRKDMSDWRFEPAVACGNAVESTLTMTITHCPVTSGGIL